jgi:hypothetical protein
MSTDRGIIKEYQISRSKYRSQGEIIMKSFKDMNKVKTVIGDMVSIDGTFNGRTITSMFLVDHIRKEGSKVEVWIKNESEGTLIVRSRSLINEM